MTVEECYNAFGGDYQDAFSRLRSDERLVKYLLKAKDDGSFKLLKEALDARNMEEAFRAAHTIKGVCLNLSITVLGQSSQKITEALRGRVEYGEDLIPLYEEVRKDYENFAQCVEKLQY